MISVVKFGNQIAVVGNMNTGNLSTGKASL
jgi:hypothetical protein